jgi:integrase
MVDLFLDSMKSQETKKDYVDAIKRFILWSGIKKELRKNNPTVIQERLIEYVVHLKNRGISYSSQNMVINAVQKYCDAYDIPINIKKVRRYTSDLEHHYDDEPYTLEQLTRLLDASDLRKRVILLLAISTGIRLGAFNGLKLKHLEKLENNIYKVIVYGDSSKYRYYTFTTPEAGRAIDDYLAFRIACGEKLSPEAPLIREEFRKENANSPHALKTDGVSALIYDMLLKLGLRKVNNTNQFARHQTARMHGFRKFYNTALVKAGVKPVVVELLMGHKVGLQNNYLRLSERDVLQEYLKAIDQLTISQEKQLKQEVAKLKADVADIETMKRSYLDMKLEIEKRDRQIQNLYAVLYQQGIIKKEA